MTAEKAYEGGDLHSRTKSLIKLMSNIVVSSPVCLGLFFVIFIANLVL